MRRDVFCHLSAFPKPPNPDGLPLPPLFGKTKGPLFLPPGTDIRSSGSLSVREYLERASKPSLTRFHIPSSLSPADVAATPLTMKDFLFFFPIEFFLFRPRHSCTDPRSQHHRLPPPLLRSEEGILSSSTALDLFPRRGNSSKPPFRAPSLYHPERAFFPPPPFLPGGILGFPSPLPGLNGEFVHDSGGAGLSYAAFSLARSARTVHRPFFFSNFTR